MSYIKVGQENSQPIEIYYEDHGSGSPVVLIHGWPLNGDAWEKQTAALLAAGHRVITYDRRGFGRSSKPGVGYNYDTFAADLDALLSGLDLDRRLAGRTLDGHRRDYTIHRQIRHQAAPQGRADRHARSLSGQGARQSRRCRPRKCSTTIRAGIKADRPVALMEFLKNFYSVGGDDGKRVSERVIEANWAVAIGASPIGTLACVDAWIEDFRKDIAAQ